MIFKLEICVDNVESAIDAQNAGADRLLTSGQKNKAEDGVELIRQLTDIAGNRLIVMPGSGINESNISSIARIT